jgi:hypothetical protein
LGAVFQGAYIFLFDRLFRQVEHKIMGQEAPAAGTTAKGTGY